MQFFQNCHPELIYIFLSKRKTRKNIAMRKQREKEIKKLATKIHCEKQDEKK